MSIMIIWVLWFSPKTCAESDVTVQAGRGVGQGSGHPRHHGRHLQKAGGRPISTIWTRNMIAWEIVQHCACYLGTPVWMMWETTLSLGITFTFTFTLSFVLLFSVQFQFCDWLNKKTVQGDSFGAGRLYGEAGTCYRKFSSEAAVSSYLKVTDIGTGQCLENIRKLINMYLYAVSGDVHWDGQIWDPSKAPWSNCSYLCQGQYNFFFRLLIYFLIFCDLNHTFVMLEWSSFVFYLICVSSSIL